MKENNLNPSKSSHISPANSAQVDAFDEEKGENRAI